MRHSLLPFVTIALMLPPVCQAAAPVARLEGDQAACTLAHLGWDTEGGDRAAVNLLRPNSRVSIRVADRGQWRDATSNEVRLSWKADGAGGFALTGTVDEG